MRRLALALSLVLIVPLLAAVYACSNQARAQEALTTWRAGDVITYRVGCHDAEAMVEVARGGGEALRQFAIQTRCFRTSGPLAAELLEWIAGPFERDGLTGSIWQVRDAQGDVEFVLLYDDSGPHSKTEARI